MMARYALHEMRRRLRFFLTVALPISALSLIISFATVDLLDLDLPISEVATSVLGSALVFAAFMRIVRLIVGDMQRKDGERPFAAVPSPTHRAVARQVLAFGAALVLWSVMTLCAWPVHAALGWSAGLILAVAAAHFVVGVLMSLLALLCARLIMFLNHHDASPLSSPFVKALSHPITTVLSSTVPKFS